MAETKKLPAGRLTRLARLAALGARTGASFALSKSGDGAARQAAEVLGSLRGLAAKVGQMASYVDGFVPESHRDAFETALAGLRAAAPSSSPAAIRAVVEEELGSPIERLFSEWESEPMASASIGQVHRARLEDGREVAVKVQHPGIERAIESDLSNVGMLESVISTLGPKGLETKRTVAEVAARFREELDYVHEAGQQRWFREFHAADPQIGVPRVIDERSSRRVLTTEMASGLGLEAAAERDGHARRAWAETLWRFVFRGNLVGGRFNADPHPGNYFFRDAGAVTFLDFGCVQPIDQRAQKEALDLHRAALSRDEPAFREAVKCLLRTRGGSYEDFSIAYSRRLFEPLFASPYRIERKWVAGLAAEVAEAKRHIFGKQGHFVAPPPGMALMNRLQFGFYSVLARFDVEVDYRATELGFLSGE